MVRLNHIGIALGADAQALQAQIRLFKLLGLELDHAVAVPEQGVKTHFFPFQSDSKGSQIELLEASDPEGTVAQFVKKRGAGIHHLSFTVEKGCLSGLCETLRKEGIKLIYDRPRKGAHEMNINFIHPASAGGVLIELMESGAK